MVHRVSYIIIGFHSKTVNEKNSTIFSNSSYAIIKSSCTIKTRFIDFHAFVINKKVFLLFRVH
ncbi:hypothetical protein Halhy_6437 [Haliscomenobacter hydrossis DSM 1100]|uniref:Uncharacterized protein n=1 Tax=Haliscomenobacter hydrossis (strain ATCC 27775 / DSM 1100 / LMG 10767 / O) TaxID=760192 RepID=F4KR68_HALH1|nr:hypothetical protein Halhy_6437 [Haliscomenobacter hydrossis DSM 1100]